MRSSSHYILQLRCGTGRNSRSYPPHPCQHTGEYKIYRDAILFTLFLYVFFIFRHTERSISLFSFGFWHKLSGLFLDKLCVRYEILVLLLYLAQYIPPQITKLITEYETIRFT